MVEAIMVSPDWLAPFDLGKDREMARSLAGLAAASGCARLCHIPRQEQAVGELASPPAWHGLWQPCLFLSLFPYRQNWKQLIFRRRYSTTLMNWLNHVFFYTSKPHCDLISITAKGPFTPHPCENLIILGEMCATHCYPQTVWLPAYLCCETPALISKENNPGVWNSSIPKAFHINKLLIYIKGKISGC